MSLWRRLERIEKQQCRANSGVGCAGWGEGVPGHKIEYRVVFGDDKPIGPERCPSCGRKRVFVITFDEEG